MNHVVLGSRVYYKDNGPIDTGTIVDILLDEYPFIVKWDAQHESRYETHRITILGKEIEFNFNPSDENVDQYRGDQLALAEEESNVPRRSY